jgi:hypothetical protein
MISLVNVLQAMNYIVRVTHYHPFKTHQNKFMTFRKICHRANFMKYSLSQKPTVSQLARNLSFSMENEDSLLCSQNPLDESTA